MNQGARHQQPSHPISLANANSAERPSIQTEDNFHSNGTPEELPSPLTSKSGLLFKAAGLITGTTFNFLIALCIPSKVVRSWISIPLASSLIALLPIFSCKSCQPANSAATTCCVYLNSLPTSSASSFVLLTLSSFSSFKRWRVSSRRPRGQRVDREREL